MSVNAVRVYWNGANDFSSPANTIPINQWFMLTVIRDKDSSQVRMYINGALIHTQNVVLADLSLTTGLYIGRDSRTGTTALKGSIDDVRIYATALSAGRYKRTLSNKSKFRQSRKFICCKIERKKKIYSTA